MDTKRICSICGKPLAHNAPEGLCPECLLKAGLGTGVGFGPDTGGKAPRFTPPKIEELAAKFPQLEILEFIGQGGMGAVYKARQKQLDRVVALKILPPQAGDPAFAERFTREARALAKLNHPHIITLYEFGQSDGLFYFLMEFVDGVNLRQLLSNSRVSPREALAIVPQICEALQFAHDSGIVHRDIKPENILLDKKGLVKIADFGVAKMIAESLTEAAEKSTAASASGELTEAGSTLGTPQYMAPEQIKNSAEVDHRADIYSLGVVFYQMLTGELPSGKIEPPSRKVQIDVRLDEVVLRAMEKEPRRRYQHVSEMGTAVETISVSSKNQPQVKGVLNVMTWTKTKTAIVGAAIALLGIGTTAIVVHASLSASRAQAPLPDDISIQPLSPSVSTQAAGFSGAWLGAWDHQLAGGLVVEDISSNGTAHVIYSWGNSPWFKAGWVREIGYVSNDDLQLETNHGIQIKYILKPDGTLSGRYQIGDTPSSFATLYRVQSTNSAEIRRAAERVNLSR